jgi:TPR repeat protein
MNNSPRKHLLCLGGLVVKLLQGLIHTPRNPQRNAGRRIKDETKLRKCINSPSYISIPYWRIFLEGKFRYNKQNYDQSISCFTCAAEFELSEAYDWLSMIYLGGRVTIPKNVKKALEYIRKKEMICGTESRWHHCPEFQKTIIGLTAVKFPELADDKYAEITFIPPPGINPDLQIKFDQDGYIDLRDQSCFRKYYRLDENCILHKGIKHYHNENYQEAWICFYLLTKMNYMLGFAWIGRMYNNGFGVISCCKTVKSCFSKVSQTEYDHGVTELELAKLYFSSKEYEKAEWFYLLSDFHGTDTALKEFFRFSADLPKSVFKKKSFQATTELERARSYIVASDYQKAEWHYYLAILYGSLVAYEELDNMRDLIFFLEEGAYSRL